MKKRKVIICGVVHETNTFSSTPTTYEDFVEGGEFPPLLIGEDIVSTLVGGKNAVAGFMRAMEADGGWIAAPALWATAAPSGIVPGYVFERIAGDLLRRVEALLPCDGVYIDLHGAMAVDGLGDGDAELLRRMRMLVGDGVPIVASIDPHANVSAQMVEHCDVMVAYRTYPHTDMDETGGRCFVCLAKMAARGKRYAKAFRQLDFLIPTVFQSTEIEPNIEIRNRLLALESGAVASISYCPGFPATDLLDCVPSVLAYAETQGMADEAADELATLVRAREAAFGSGLYAPNEAVREAMRLHAALGGPVIIADTQDNPGAGTSSDTTGLLKALVDANAQNAAIGLICDPETVRIAHRAGVGATIELSLGGKSGIAGDLPLRADYEVLALSDGRVTATGPMTGKLVELGPAACLRLNGVRIAVSSQRVQMLDRDFFRAVGIAPEQADIVVVKSTAHFRADFAPIASAIIVATAPGAMPTDPATLPWTRLRPGTRLRPLGPAFTDKGTRKI